MVDSAVVTGFAAVCNRYAGTRGPACLPGDVSQTHRRRQEVNVQDFLPGRLLCEGDRLAEGVGTVLIPIHMPHLDAGHWLLARGDRAREGQGMAVGIFDPAEGDYLPTATAQAGGSMLVAREVLAGLTGLPLASIRPGAAHLPPVPAGFMQQDEVSCGVHCMMLMALWTAEAAGHQLQLPGPLHVERARAWLATALGSNILPLWGS